MLLLSKKESTWYNMRLSTEFDQAADSWHSHDKTPGSWKAANIQ